jgi:hypothetical protein
VEKDDELARIVEQLNRAASNRRTWNSDWRDLPN